MQPLQQGDCWHCGLYALINAACLLGHDAETAKTKVYQMAAEALGRPLGQYEAVNPDLMNRLLPLWEHEFAPHRLTPQLQADCTKEAPLLAGMAEPGIELHWTLVQAVQDGRLLLWDSSGRQGYDPGQWRIAPQAADQGATLFSHLLFALRRA